MIGSDGEFAADSNSDEGAFSFWLLHVGNGSPPISFSGEGWVLSFLRPYPSPFFNGGKRMEMPFGKYQGKEIEDIPSDYLRWLMDQDWFGEKFEDLFEEVEDEWDIRERSHAHFYSWDSRV